MVEKVTPSGVLSIFAGTGKVGIPTPGPARSSALGGPAFVAVDPVGNVYIADYGANVIERVTPSQTLSIFAGTGKAAAPTPGPATSSALDQPVGVAVDSVGDVYIGDATNNLVEKVTLPVPTTPTISNLPSSGSVGGSFRPTVTTSGDGATWVSSNAPSVCAVNGPTVSFVGNGICSLTAHVGIGATYAARLGCAPDVHRGAVMLGWLLDRRCRRRGLSVRVGRRLRLPGQLGGHAGQTHRRDRRHRRLQGLLAGGQ